MRLFMVWMCWYVPFLKEMHIPNTVSKTYYNHRHITPKLIDIILKAKKNEIIPDDDNDLVAKKPKNNSKIKNIIPSPTNEFNPKLSNTVIVSKNKTKTKSKESFINNLHTLTFNSFNDTSKGQIDDKPKVKKTKNINKNSIDSSKIDSISSNIDNDTTELECSNPKYNNIRDNETVVVSKKGPQTRSGYETLSKIMRERWQNPEYRERVVATLKSRNRTSPGMYESLSKKMKEKWQDPDYREKAMDRVRQRNMTDWLTKVNAARDLSKTSKKSKSNSNGSTANDVTPKPLFLSNRKRRGRVPKAQLDIINEISDSIPNTNNITVTINGTMHSMELHELKNRLIRERKAYYDMRKKKIEEIREVLLTSMDPKNVNIKDMMGAKLWFEEQHRRKSGSVYIAETALSNILRELFSSEDYTVESDNSFIWKEEDDYYMLNNENLYKRYSEIGNRPYILYDEGEMVHSYNQIDFDLIQTNYAPYGQLY